MSRLQRIQFRKALKLNPSLIIKLTLLLVWVSWPQYIGGHLSFPDPIQFIA